VTFPGPVERLQGAAFVNVFDGPVGPQRWAQGAAEPEALLVMAQRILGDEAAQALFEEAARAQGKERFLPDPTPDFLAGLEERLSGIGRRGDGACDDQPAGRARHGLGRGSDGGGQRIRADHGIFRPARKRSEAELTRTATALREANEKLTQLSVQKDAFLSQISHELRTPMTSIRAFSEILTEGDLPPEMVALSGRIIHDEAVRLTRLLDDLLDLSVLENGKVQLNLASGQPARDDRPGHPGQRTGQSRKTLRHPARFCRPRRLPAHRCRPADAGVHQPDLECPQILRCRPARVAHLPCGRRRGG
jgi:hypothetical protein